MIPIMATQSCMLLLVYHRVGHITSFQWFQVLTAMGNFSCFRTQLGKPSRVCCIILIAIGTLGAVFLVFGHILALSPGLFKK